MNLETEKVLSIMKIQNKINAIFDKISKVKSVGEVASYIPELKKIDSKKFGVCLVSSNFESIGKGDYLEQFSIQSIAKVLSLSLAYQKLGEKIWKRVGVESSGNAFNSLIQLEYDSGIPRNPFINAGAIVICDILFSELKNPKKDLIEFVRSIAGEQSIRYNKKIVQSEKSFGYRNAALVNLMKSFGNIKNNPDEVLDFYFTVCSIEMNCQELATTFLYLSNNGIHPITKKRILTMSQSKRINAIMLSCGFYDESGEFSFKVGLPGKSGVGGGIIAIYPNHFSIAVWSPRLNQKGNSYKGMKFLEKFTTDTKMSVF